MTPESLAFLKSLLDTPGPSSFEAAPARLWRAEAEKLADSVQADVGGNSFATLNAESRPRLMLAGHIDEIGIMVTHIDDEGYLSFDTIGGWDHQVFVGQRVILLGRGRAGHRSGGQEGDPPHGAGRAGKGLQGGRPLDRHRGRRIGPRPEPGCGSAIPVCWRPASSSSPTAGW